MIESKFISANPNTVRHCGTYSKKTKCFLFASANLIHVYSPKKGKTFFTLNGHSDRVNAVKFLEGQDNPFPEFLSGASDGKISHWLNTSKNHDVFDFSSWKLQKQYTTNDKAKNVSINLLSALYISPVEKYFATMTSNGIIDLFYYDIDLNEFKLFYSLNYERQLQNALCLCVLDQNFLLLLSGGYNTIINVHTVMRIKTMNNALLNNETNQEKIVPCQLKAKLSGHANDIRDIAAVDPANPVTFFCSGSQDSYIRTWNVTKLTKDNHLTELAGKVNTKGTHSIFDEYKSKTSYVISVPGLDEKDKNELVYYNITLDSVLSGHEDAISSVQWGKLEDGTNAILSSSFDFTVVIWVYDKKHNIWNKQYTLGEMLGNRHAFFYAEFLDDVNDIIAYAFNGAMYLWHNNNGEYKNDLVIHGHFNKVNDVEWDPTHNILFSCSSDETTRAFGFWKANDTWHEINRPQIHGYEINSIALMQSSTEKDVMCKLISAADEKLIRVFTPPFNIVKFLSTLSEKDDIKFKADNTNEYYEKFYANVEGSKQALGLMNREIMMDNNDEVLNVANFNPDAVLTNKGEQFYISKYDYTRPPNEDFLSNNTLWPEEKKMYGHGCEIYSIGISHNGKYLASAQKAQNEKNAKVFLWDNTTGKLIDKYDGHKLTIIELRFSKSDKYLLTVSRDRSWCVFAKKDNEDKYELIQSCKNAHGRIIWACCWTDDEKYFITVSRDKSIAVWGEENNKFSKVSKIEVEVPVTAVEMIKKVSDSAYLFVVGLENGQLTLYKFDCNAKAIEKVHEFDKWLCHGASVKRIRGFELDEKTFRIGTCSEDHSVRIFDIKLNKTSS